jgi:hypothetical protein
VFRADPIVAAFVLFRVTGDDLGRDRLESITWASEQRITVNPPSDGVSIKEIRGSRSKAASIGTGCARAKGRGAWSSQE